jgi:hypothetical protein
MASCFYFFYDHKYQYFGKFDVIITLFQVTVITIFLPISIYFLLKSLGKIDTIMVSKTSQRKIPLATQAFLILILVNFGITEARIPELYCFFLGGFLSTLICLFLAFGKVKASIHMVGMASLLFFVIGLSLHTQRNFINLISILLVLTGIVASSRISMKAHNYTELILGFLCGMISQIIFWKFWI